MEPDLLDGDKLVFLRECLDDESLEQDFLRHTVGVQLQADRASLDPLGFWIVPINNSLAIDGYTHTVALCENFNVVPIVLLANLPSGSTINW